MKRTIAILAGDGIGPEVMSQAVRVLRAIDVNEQLELQPAMIGGCAYEKYGKHYPEETDQICQQAQAILFGSVGGPIDQTHLAKWQQCETHSILALRKRFELSINVRPAKLYPTLVELSPLNSKLINQGIDIMIIRELVGDIYFGEHKQFINNHQRHAFDACEYNETQIKRAAHFAFTAAKQRRKKVTSIDKANVLATSKLWRSIVDEVAEDYPDIHYEHMLVDNCAMQLILNPKQFDVMVTANLFGDILSDQASAIPGSLGLMPSASFNQDGFGLYEPSGGSAPDIAGKNIANPIGQILSMAMMLRHSFDMNCAANDIEQAIFKTLEKGYRTQDIYTEGDQLVGTMEITDMILQEL